MQENSFLIDYVLLHADNALMLAQRNSAWCGHGPVLEQDIAITNISLDLIGQSRNFFQYAAELINIQTKFAEPQATEDSLAFLRDIRNYKNCLITEFPRGDWAFTVLRQFFFSTYQFYLFKKLQESCDKQLAAIAEKSLKEVTYHVKWSSEWVVRLGDGTAESNERMHIALKELWTYTGELFLPAPFEVAAMEYGYGADLQEIQIFWNKKVQEILEEATLEAPFMHGKPDGYMQTGGKSGIHTEHMGYLLAEMQYMQRTYPGAEW